MTRRYLKTIVKIAAWKRSIHAVHSRTWIGASAAAPTRSTGAESPLENFTRFCEENFGHAIISFSIAKFRERRRRARIVGATSGKPSKPSGYKRIGLASAFFTYLVKDLLCGVDVAFVHVGKRQLTFCSSRPVFFVWKIFDYALPCVACIALERKNVLFLNGIEPMNFERRLLRRSTLNRVANKENAAP